MKNKIIFLIIISSFLSTFSGNNLCSASNRPKSWTQILESIEEISVNSSLDVVEDILGEPRFVERKGSILVYQYTERESYGTMAYVSVEFKNDKVINIEKGFISIDPW